MINIEEFLKLQGLELELAVLKWHECVDNHFVDYFVANHFKLPLQHLNCAMYLAASVNRDDVREIIKNDLSSPEMIISATARGCLMYQSEHFGIPTECELEAMFGLQSRRDNILTVRPETERHRLLAELDAELAELWKKPEDL